MVHLFFEANGKQWEVLRTRKHPEHGNAVQWWINGEARTPHLQTEAKKALEAELPISHQVFRHAIQIGQGLPDRFLALSEPDKQKLLCEILSLGLYDDAHARSKNSFTHGSAEVAALENQVAELETTTAEWKSQLRVAQEEDASLDEALRVWDETRKGNIEELNEKLQGLHSEWERLQKEYVQKSEGHRQATESLAAAKEVANDQVRSAERARDAALSVWAQRVAEVGEKVGEWKASASAIVTKATLSESSLANVESKGNKCSQCGQDVQGVEDFQASLDFMRKEVGSLQIERDNINQGLEQVVHTQAAYSADRDKALEAWNSHISGLVSDVSHVTQEESAKVASLLSDLESIHEQSQLAARETDACQHQIKELEKWLESKAATIRGLEMEQARVRERVSIVGGYISANDCSLDLKRIILGSKKKDLACWEYWKISIPNLRAAALDEVLNYLNVRTNEYLDTFSGGVMGMDMHQVRRGKGSKVKVDLKTPGGSYEMSSGGERRRVDLAIYLALSDLVHAASGVSCNFVVADEIMDGLSPQGVRKFAEVLRAKAERGMCVFVVSHNPAVQQIVEFDSTITIEKRNGKAVLV